MRFKSRLKEKKALADTKHQIMTQKEVSTNHLFRTNLIVFNQSSTLQSRWKMRKFKIYSSFFPICQRHRYNKLITTLHQKSTAFGRILREISKFGRFRPSSFQENPARESSAERNDHNFYVFGPILIIFGREA